MNAFAAGGRGTQPQPVGAPERHDLLVYADGPKKGQDVMADDIVADAPPITAQAKDPATGQVRESEKATVLMYRTSTPDKIASGHRGRHLARHYRLTRRLCTHQGCLVDGWDAANKVVRLPLPSRVSSIPSLAARTSAEPRRATSRRFQSKDDEGKLIVSDAIMSWIGVKRT